MKARNLLVVIFVLVGPTSAAPPEIDGGGFLSGSVGVNAQPIVAWTTSEPYEVILFDPDPGEQLRFSIKVAGPLGGIRGGELDDSAPSGTPVVRSLEFIAGIVPGLSWIEIYVSDGTSSTTSYINFEILPHTDPPQAAMFESGADDDPYHFLLMITNPEVIAEAELIVAGQLPQRIVDGEMVKGDGAFNVNTVDPTRRPWPWYMDPTSVILAETTAEYCDGDACAIEPEIDYWVSELGHFCPWETFLREYQPQPPVPEPDLRLGGGRETVIFWEPVPDAVVYDVIRGGLRQLWLANEGYAECSDGCCVDLDDVVCLVNDTPANDSSAYPDTSIPPSGDAFFYLVRYDDSGRPFPYGHSSLGWQRETGAGDCPGPPGAR